jgi:ABC-type siderophore export system fused ATPase/permease subunit
MSESKFNEAGFDASYNKKESIKYGVILGVISLLVGILVLVFTKSIESFWLLIGVAYGLNTILYIILALIFTYLLRKRNGGYWNFSIALKSTFLMLLISTLISTISTTMYVHTINPALQEEVLRNTINVTIEHMESSGAPDDVIDSRVATLENQMNSLGEITFKSTFRSVMISILMQFIFSLVLAALTRNEKLSQGALPKKFN